MSNLPHGAERFLRQLDAALARLPAAERADLVAELRTHLADRAAGGVEAPELAFGDPLDYAAALVQERALTGALAGGGSLALGRALLSGPGRLAWWWLVATLGVLHLYALALLVCAALKPIFPDRVGFFAQGANVALGALLGPTAPGPELLGWWALPAFLVPGVLLLWGSHAVLRRLARWRLEAVRLARASSAA